MQRILWEPLKYLSAVVGFYSFSSSKYVSLLNSSSMPFLVFVFFPKLCQTCKQNMLFDWRDSCEIFSFQLLYFKSLKCISCFSVFSYSTSVKQILVKLTIFSQHGISVKSCLSFKLFVKFNCLVFFLIK